MHYVVTDDGNLYTRTSYSRNNSVDATDGQKCYLKGVVVAARYLTAEGIWVVREQLFARPNLKFKVEAKGPGHPALNSIGGSSIMGKVRTGSIARRHDAVARQKKAEPMGT